ncbi:hypothetical protein NIES298_37470 [Microcystis aeruginosa NIES-298]|nr:hypothetical protein NIES298_37470 [Microcystis aeruginosa NIES-298]
MILCQLFWEYTTNAPTLAQFVLFVNKLLIYSGRDEGFLSGGSTFASLGLLFGWTKMLTIPDNTADIIKSPKA